MWYSGSLSTNEPRWITKLPTAQWGPNDQKVGGGENTVVRNISFSLKYLELGQAGHCQVNYLYLAEDRDGNGDRLSFWAPPWGATLGLGSPGVEDGELEESGYGGDLGEKGKEATWLMSRSLVPLYCLLFQVWFLFMFKKMTTHMYWALTPSTLHAYFCEPSNLPRVTDPILYLRGQNTCPRSHSK